MLVQPRGGRSVASSIAARAIASGVSSDCSAVRGSGALSIGCGLRSASDCCSEVTSRVGGAESPPFAHPAAIIATPSRMAIPCRDRLIARSTLPTHRPRRPALDGDNPIKDPIVRDSSTEDFVDAVVAAGTAHAREGVFRDRPSSARSSRWSLSGRNLGDEAFLAVTGLGRTPERRGLSSAARALHNPHGAR